MIELDPEALGPLDSWVTEQVAEGEEEHAQLMSAFQVAAAPLTRHVPLAMMTEAYQVAGYYYAVSKDLRRRSQAEGKLEAQLCEDYLEALVKGIDKSIMAAMHLGKQERYGG